MARGEVVDSLTDDRLMREIDAVIDVQPSPELVARIRTRIDSEPVRSRLFEARWLACATVAACLAAMIATRANWPERRQESRAPSAAATPTVAARPIDPQSKPSDVVMPTSRSESVRVLVSPAEAAGLRSLVSALREGRLDPGVLPDANEEVEPPIPLVIEPITVEPLVAAADVESGVRQ